MWPSRKSFEGLLTPYHGPHLREAFVINLEPKEPPMTNDQTQALLSRATEACGCAVCECGDDCACASAQPGASACKACEDAGCGCGA